MLKMIHFAKPTINYSEYVKHQQFTDKLKKQLENGPSRYSML